MRLDLPTLRRLVVYTMVGAAGTFAQFAILVALMEGAGLRNAVWASTIGAIAGAGINYALNYRFTFRSRSRHAEALPKFFATATLGFALNAAVMAVLTHIWRGQYLVAQVAATGCVFLTTFFINSAWTFQNKAAEQ